eukprot:COSAG06_NODE_233_length_19608_cov_129.527244_7_plen_191_part_00
MRRFVTPCGHTVTLVLPRSQCDHRVPQSDPAFCLAAEHLAAVRARRPRLHGQAPRPPHRLEVRSPHLGVPQPSFRQRRQSGHKNAPSRRKIRQRRCTGGAPKLRSAAVRRSSRDLFCGSSLTRSCNRRPQRRTRWAQAADHRGTWRWRTAPRCAHAVPRWQCARALMPRQCCASSRLRRRRLRSLETSRH